MTSSKPPRPTRSGEHPAVLAFREKLDSIQDHTLPACEVLAAAAVALREKTSKPPIKRQDDDEELHVDVVPLPEDAPLPKRTREKP